MNTIRIKQICIKNFRGYAGEHVFDIDFTKRFIFLSGINGLGKTSFFDAIEWTLTGTINRLQRELKERQDKATETTQNGYIKNITKLEENTRVHIVFLYKDKDFTIVRSLENEEETITTKKIPEGSFDVLNLDVYDEGDQAEIKKILQELGSGEFFSNNLCSYDKNINLYTSNKQDIAALIYKYLYNSDKADAYIAKLETFKSIIEDKENNIVKQKEKIDSEKTEIEQQINEVAPIDLKPEDYPIQIYNTEYNILDLMQIEHPEEKYTSIDNQINILDKIKRLLILNYYLIDANNYVNSLEKLYNLNWFTEIRPILNSIKEPLNIFNVSVENNVVKEKQKLLEEIEANLNQAADINYNSLLINIFNKDSAVFEQISEALKECIPKIKEINKIKLEEAASGIYQLKENIELLKAFQKTEYAEFCPLCKSTYFKTADIESNINSTIGVLGEQITLKTKLKEELSQIIDSKLSYLFNLNMEKLTSLDENIISIQEIFNNNEIENFIISDNKTTNEYQLLIESLSKDVCDYEKNFAPLFDDDNFITIWKFEQTESIQIKYKFVKEKTNEHSDLLQELKTTIEFDDVLLCPSSNSEIKRTMPACEYRKLYYETFNIIDKKIKMLNELKIRSINENSIQKLSKELKQQNIFLKKIKEQEPILNKFKEEIKNLTTQIRTLKNNTNEQIGKSLGDSIKKIFNRINRHNNFKIDTTHSGRTISSFEIVCIDETTGQKVNSPIIMSTGQISTLALSIFWAILNAKKQNIFRCYFLDDPIQSIDDLNILSFIDLLRSELQNETAPVFDQMFFATCDTKLEGLIKHKFTTFGINFDLYNFINYAKYEKISI